MSDALQLTETQRAALQDLCIATPLQQGLISLAQRSARDPYYLQRVFELNGPFAADAFVSAWQSVIDRHPALRTDFRWDGLDAPVQLVRKHAAVDVRSLDWRHLSEGDARDALATQWREVQARGFDFAQTSHAQLLLIERGTQCRWFVWRFHHAQLDGWSIGLVLRDVLQAYDAALSRTSSIPTPNAAPAFSHYVRWLEQQNRDGDALAQWRPLLADWSRTPLPLAASSHAPHIPHASHADASLPDSADHGQPLEHTVRLPQALTAQAEQFARAAGVTLNTLIQGAWAWLLSRHANRREVSFGVTVSGRGDGWPGAGDTVGLFINTLPLSVELPPAMTVHAWLAALQSRNLALQELAQTPLAQLQREITGAAGEPLFESIFVFENYPLDASLRTPLVHGLAIERLATGADGHAHDGRNHFPLSLIAVPGDELTLTLAAQSQRFDGATVRRLLAQLQQALAMFTANAARTLGALHLPSDAQITGSTKDITSARSTPETAASAAWQGGLLKRIAQHAHSQPTAIALHDETRTLDWATLWRLSGALAARLAAAGVRTETTVAVVLPRRAELIVAMLAVWRAGGVYAPFDPAAPGERLGWQIRDAEAHCLIADADADWRPDNVALVACTPECESMPDAASATLPTLAALPADLAAYLIYTSGSTGIAEGRAGLAPLACRVHRGATRPSARWHSQRRVSVDTGRRSRPLDLDGGAVVGLDPAVDRRSACLRCRRVRRLVPHASGRSAQDRAEPSRRPASCGGCARGIAEARVAAGWRSQLPCTARACLAAATRVRHSWPLWTDRVDRRHHDVRTRRRRRVAAWPPTRSRARLSARPRRSSRPAGRSWRNPRGRCRAGARLSAASGAHRRSIRARSVRARRTRLSHRRSGAPARRRSA